MAITKEQVEKIAPALLKNSSIEEINEMFEKYQITTPNRIAGWFCQCGHESADFRYKGENLNYSAEGLIKTFGKYFKGGVAEAQAYARKPERIANRVYANRMGNGNEASGDGWKFKGRGYIQLTGKENYTGFSKHMGFSIDEAVAYCETNKGAMESAMYFWARGKCNDFCDKEDILGLTKRINGGTNGLKDRQERYAKYKKILQG